MLAQFTHFVHFVNHKLQCCCCFFFVCLFVCFFQFIVETASFLDTTWAINSYKLLMRNDFEKHFNKKINLFIFSLSIPINMRFRYFHFYSFDNDDMKSSKRHVILLSLIFLLK